MRKSFAVVLEFMCETCRRQEGTPCTAELSEEQLGAGLKERVHQLGWLVMLSNHLLVTRSFDEETITSEYDLERTVSLNPISEV